MTVIILMLLISSYSSAMMVSKFSTQNIAKLKQQARFFHKPGCNRYHDDYQAISASNLLTNPSFKVYEFIKSINGLRSIENSRGLLMDCIYQAHLNKRFEAHYQAAFAYALSHSYPTINLNQALPRNGYQEYDERDGTDHNLPALHCCAKYDLPSFIDTLLAYKIDVNQLAEENELCRSALHHAQSIQVADQLLKAGADINQKDFYANTPLHTCPAWLVSHLIKNNADITSTNRGMLLWSEHPEHVLSHLSDKDLSDIRNYLKIASYKLKGISVSFDDRGLKPSSPGYLYYQTPLMKAIAEQDTEKIVALMGHTPKEIFAKEYSFLVVLCKIYYRITQKTVFQDILKIFEQSY